MKNVILNEKEYELLQNNKECFNLEETQNLCTDYFDDFDYIFGDYSYGKLRLKGFYEKDSKKVQIYNNISNYSKYLKEYCAEQCSYFLLKKIKKNKC